MIAEIARPNGVGVEMPKGPGGINYALLFCVMLHKLRGPGGSITITSADILAYMKQVREGKVWLLPDARGDACHFQFMTREEYERRQANKSEI